MSSPILHIKEKTYRLIYEHNNERNTIMIYRNKRKPLNQGLLNTKKQISEENLKRKVPKQIMAESSSNTSNG